MEMVGNTIILSKKGGNRFSRSSQVGPKFIFLFRFGRNGLTELSYLSLETCKAIEAWAAATRAIGTR